MGFIFLLVLGLIFLPNRIKAAETDPLLTFTVYGDSRTASTFPNTHSMLVEKMLPHNPDFVLHAGDIVHCYDQQGSQWQDQFERNVLPLKQRNIPIYPTIGNHELELCEGGAASCNNKAAYDEYHRRFPHVSFNSYGDYSFNVRGIHFISIDILCFMGTQPKFDWISQDLSQNRDKFTFALLHRPPYTTGKGCQDDQGKGYQDERVMAAIRESSVVMIFSGDDHSYQRLLPPNEDDRVFFVAAGGGAPLYDKTCTPSWEHHKKEHHFILVKVYRDRVETKAINLEGQVIDQYTKYVAVPAGLPIPTAVFTPTPTGAPTATPTGRPLLQGYPKIFMPSGGMALPSSTFLRDSVNYDQIVISGETLGRQDLYDLLKETKRQNPNLTVLLYVAAQEVPAWSSSTSPLYGGIYEYAKSHGWLYASCGSCSCWGGNACVDISSGWKDYLPQTMNNWIAQHDPNHLVNGVFYDNAKKDPFCCPQNGDLWREAMRTIFRNTNGLTGGNELYYPSASPYLGHLDWSSREGWPGVNTPCGWKSNWNNGMRSFYGWVKEGGYYGIAYNPCSIATDFRTMRFGLTSSLLADRGYYHYWPGVLGTTGYTDNDCAKPIRGTPILVYDEYAVDLSSGQATRQPQHKGYLGQPVALAYDPLTGEGWDEVYRRNLTGCTDGTNADLSSHVWVREYQNGVVIVNPSSSSKIITKNQLPKGGNLKRIRGSQDPSFNNGSLIGDSIILPPQDGIILLSLSTLSPTPTLSPDSSCDCQGASRQQRSRGDFNCDDKVDFFDYNLWVNRFNRGDNPDEDLSCNGEAGIEDFAVWVSNYQSSLN